MRYPVKTSTLQPQAAMHVLQLANSETTRKIPNSLDPSCDENDVLYTKTSSNEEKKGGLNSSNKQVISATTNCDSPLYATSGSAKFQGRNLVYAATRRNPRKIPRGFRRFAETVPSYLELTDSETLVRERGRKGRRNVQTEGGIKEMVGTERRRWTRPRLYSSVDDDGGDGSLMMEG